MFSKDISTVSEYTEALSALALEDKEWLRESCRSLLQNKDIICFTTAGADSNCLKIIALTLFFQKNPDGVAMIISVDRDELNCTKELIKNYPQLGEINVSELKEETAPQNGTIYMAEPRLTGKSDNFASTAAEVSLLIVDQLDRFFYTRQDRWLQSLLQQCRPPEQRWSLFFSFKSNNEILSLSYKKQNRPNESRAMLSRTEMENFSHQIFHTNQSEKFSLLVGLLRKNDKKNVAIFCNNNRKLDEIKENLAINNIFPMEKQGQKDSSKKNSKIWLLAPSFAAGNKAQPIDVVIFYQISEEAVFYGVRLASTIKPSDNCQVISLIDDRDVFYLSDLESFYQTNFTTKKVEKELLPETRFIIQPKESFSRREAGGNDGKREAGNTKKAGNRGNRDKPLKENKHSAPERRKTTVIKDERNKTDNRSGNKSRKERQGRRDGETGNRNRNRIRKESQPENMITREQSLQSRIAYYERKYGEKFTAVSPDISGTADSLPKDSIAINHDAGPEKKSFFKKFFSGKK